MQISKRSKVDIGDVLFAMIGTIGNPVVIKNEPKYAIKNVGLFKNPKKIISSELLKYYLDSLTFNSQIEEKQFLKGTTQKFIPLGHLRQIEIPLPPHPEQRAIVSKIELLFSELDNGIANLKLAQEQLKVYRQAVLKKAFEGELTRKWREQQTDLPYTQNLMEQIRREWEEATKASRRRRKQLKNSPKRN
jgi:type I restriction enzyme S subunit